MTLQDKHLLITGASRGLGHALALAAARAGARVSLVARQRGPLEAAAEAITAAGGQANVIAADVGDRDAAHSIAGQAAARFGAVDVLIHNASTLGAVPLPLLLDTRDADFERAFEVNVLGPFRLTKVVLASMVLRGGGTVVAISSDAAIEAYPRWGAYGASKAALDHLTRIWAAELEDTGVRVFSVDPGEMNTQMHADAIPDANPCELADPAVVAEAIVRLLARPPLAPHGTRHLASEVSP